MIVRPPYETDTQSRQTSAICITSLDRGPTQEDSHSLTTAVAIM